MPHHKRPPASRRIFPGRIPPPCQNGFCLSLPLPKNLPPQPSRHKRPPASCRIFPGRIPPLVKTASVFHFPCLKICRLSLPAINARQQAAGFSPAGFPPLVKTASVFHFPCLKICRLSLPAINARRLSANSICHSDPHSRLRPPRFCSDFSPVSFVCYVPRSYILSAILIFVFPATDTHKPYLPYISFNFQAFRQKQIFSSCFPVSL